MFLVQQLVAEQPETLSAASIIWRLGVAMLLVVANAFFVAAEFSLVGSRRARIEALARSGNRRAKIANVAIQRLDHYISGTQLGITFASLGLGWVGESTIAVLIIGAFDGLAAPWNVLGTHLVAVSLAFGFITFMHIVLGELVPKSLALLHTEETAMWTAGPLIVFSRVLGPFIAILNGSANLLLRVFGMRAPTKLESVHRPEELEMMLTQSYEHGLLRAQPVEMIRGVFHLSETSVEEVMTPRTEVIAIPLDMPLEQAADFALDHGHSRYPVFEDALDRVVGVVLARDVWRALREGTPSLSQIVREAFFVPDSKRVEQLLREMQAEQSHMAIVVDEFGGTAGIVTIEDLVEEIVGEIDDELDVVAPELEEAPTGEILIRGKLTISDLNERYALDLPDEDYTTVGGFVLGRLGRIARVGDEVGFRGGRLRVFGMKGRRVDRLALTLSPTPVEVSSEDQG